MEFSDRNCREFMEQLPEAVFLETLEGEILDVNDGACDLLGYEREELLELTVDDLVPEGEPAFLPGQIDEATRSGKPLETVNLDKGGNEIPIELRGKIIEMEGNERMLVTVRDISERQKVRRKYQVVAEGTTEAIYLLQDGEFKFFNEGLEQLTDYTYRELKGIDFLELVHPDYREKVAEWTQRALTGDVSELPERVEYKGLTKEGETIWVRTLPSLIEYQGEPAIVGNPVDITEQKELEERLKKRERSVESALSAIAIADLEGNLEYVNPAFLQMWGYEKEEEILGRKVTEFWKSRQKAETAFRIVKQKGRWSGELLGEKQGGTSFQVRAFASLVTDDQGEPIAAMSSFNDITERKEAKEELKANQEKLTELHKTIVQLNSHNSEKELCRTTVKLVENILELELCALDLLEGDVLVPKATSTGLPEEDPRKQEIGEGLGGKTIEKGKTYWGDDVRNCELADPSREDFRAYISVPIGQLGIIQVVSTEKGAFSNQDVEMMEIIAGHLREEINRVRLEEDLRQQAIRDPLTDLYNRRYFNETLKKEVQKAERYERPLAFLMLDVNRFKEVNDRYTHQIGDEVLQEVANLLKKDVRDADTVVRYGGDEFLIMMPETNGDLKNVTERLKENLARWNKRNDLLDFPITLAMGVSHWSPSQKRDVEEALKEADRKMYGDKGENG